MPSSGFFGGDPFANDPFFANSGGSFGGFDNMMMDMQKQMKSAMN